MKLAHISIPSISKVKDITLALGLGWAVYTFIWKEHLSNEFMPPKLQISTTAQMVRQGNRYNLVKLSFKAINTGSQAVNLLSDLWSVYEVDHHILATSDNDKAFDDRVKWFLKKGADDDKIERASTTRYGRVLAVGSLGWHSLQPGESQTVSTLVTLPSASRDIYLAIRTPYAKHLDRNSNTWIDWEHTASRRPIKAKICIPAEKSPPNNDWQCFPEGTNQYNHLTERHGIRLAHDEQSFAI